MDRSTIARLDEVTRRRYDERLNRLGPSPQALGWDSVESQRARFRSAVRLLDIRGRSVLDVGCGFGDLLGFLREVDRAPASYHGIDINSRLLRVGAARYPEARFEERNLLLDPLNAAADVVFMFGVLNFRLSRIDNQDFARAMIEAAWNAARRALVVDMLSAVRDPAYPCEDFVFYYDPACVLGWALELTPHVALLHDLPSLPQRELQLVLRRSAVS